MKPQKAFKDASLHFGIIGTLAFVVFILIFQEDWTGRYRFLTYLLPSPVISLLIAKKYPLLGGLLLIVLGIGTAIFDVYFSPAHPGQITGVGLAYTLIFVTAPLVISGAFNLVFWKYC